MEKEHIDKCTALKEEFKSARQSEQPQEEDSMVTTNGKPDLTLESTTNGEDIPKEEHGEKTAINGSGDNSSTEVNQVTLGRDQLLSNQVCDNIENITETFATDNRKDNDRELLHDNVQDQDDLV